MYIRILFFYLFCAFIHLACLSAQTIHLRSEFTVADPSPVADPYFTDPTLDTLDMFQIAGQLSISGGHLLLTYTGNPINSGQLGFLSNEVPLLRVFGRALFGNFIWTAFPTDYGQSFNPPLVFGYNKDGTFGYTPARGQGFAIDVLPSHSAHLAINDPDSMQKGEALMRSLTFPLIAGDSTKVAVISGGYDNTEKLVYYFGQNRANYNHGSSYFVKHRNSPQWLLFGRTGLYSSNLRVQIMAGEVSGATGTPIVELDRFVVTDIKQVDDSFLSPLSYVSGVGTNGTDFPSGITPEVGSWIKKGGTWQVQGNYIQCTVDIGSPPVFEDVLITDTGKADVYVEVVVNLTAGAGISTVLRWNPSDSSHYLVQLSDASDRFRMYRYTGGMNGTYTLQEEVVLTSLAISPSTDYTIRCRTIADTLEAWVFLSRSAIETLLAKLDVVSSINNGQTWYGVRTYLVGPKFKAWKSYPVGTGSEYAVLNDYYNLSTQAGLTDIRRRGLARSIVY